MSAAEYYNLEYDFDSPQSFSGEASKNEPTPTPAAADPLPPLPWPNDYKNGEEHSPPNCNTIFVRHRVYVVGGQSKKLPGGSNFMVQDKDGKSFPMEGHFQMYLKAKDESTGIRDESGNRVVSNIIPDENTELSVIFFIKKSAPHVNPWEVRWRLD